MNILQRMKPLLSSLREKKRYVVFQSVSLESIPFKDISKSIKEHFLSLVGIKGYAKAGIIILPERWNKSKNMGIIKVNHTSLSDLKMALASIKSVNGEKAIMQSIGVSGILNKTKKFMI